MAKASPIIAAFNSGEFSPLMAGRVDLKYYQNACKHTRNFIPMVQGPARNRPGTRMVDEVKSSADRTWLKEFVYSRNQSYMMEFGHLYIRFYADHSLIESSPGVPFEVATPFTAASLTRSDGTFRLKFAQTGDVVYITSDGQYPAQKLSRLTISTFSLAELKTVGGPFNDLDPDATITVYASANAGAGITLTASAALFTASHVGASVFLEQKKIDDIKMWEPGKVYAIGNIRRSDGKNYKALNAATSGGVKPLHSEGSRYDGDAGVQWEFQDPGYGWAEITGYTDSTHVTATVKSRIPDGAVGVGNATTRWAFSAFSAVEGYPDNVSFFRERLTFSKRLRIFQSVASDFEVFKRTDDGGIITKDMAAIIDITAEESNDIIWMAPFSSALLVGTGGEEFAIDEITQIEAYGPGNIKSNRQSKHGSSYAGIAVVGDGVIFLQAVGRKIRDMVPAESVDKKWASSDVTVLAEHVTKGGVTSITYQQEPDSNIWVTRTDGQLIGFTLNREQDVRGWHPHRIGGVSDTSGNFAVVECVATKPIPGGDELWMIVRRQINGATKRYVEYVAPMRGDGDDPEDAFYVDGGLTLNNTLAATLTPGAGANVTGSTGVMFLAGTSVFIAGHVGRRIHYRYSTQSITGKVNWHKAVAEITSYVSGTEVHATIHSPWPNLTAIASGGWRITATTITGLDHLEGETVTACGDGSSLGQYVVAGGQITLQDGVSKAHVGFPIRAVLVPMPIEAGATDGTAQGKTKRISRCGIRFHESLGAKYGRAEDETLDDLPVRDAAAAMDSPPELFTGDVTVSWPDGYSDDALIAIVQDEPLPCTVVAIMPQITTQDSR
jgi:hypothetical protein